MSTISFMPLLRELASTYQAFEIYSAPHIRSLDLTPPQFDIIATLGNTQGMTPKHLGEKTLITKGTLTGVVDRLVGKGLVRRIESLSDGRSQIIQLTEEGAQMFERIFPAHILYMQRAFDLISAEDMIEMTAMLSRLRLAFSAAHKGSSS
jgi:MarR family transcriptional regulator, 2-MHQ and catechol-resistance regulon repressor